MVRVGVSPIRPQRPQQPPGTSSSVLLVNESVSCCELFACVSKSPRIQGTRPPGRAALPGGRCLAVGTETQEAGARVGSRAQRALFGTELGSTMYWRIRRQDDELQAS